MTRTDALKFEKTESLNYDNFSVKRENLFPTMQNFLHWFCLHHKKRKYQELLLDLVDSENQKASHIPSVFLVLISKLETLLNC